MRTKFNFKKNTATFTGIMNESQLEMVTLPASKVGCKTEVADFCTKVVVSGTVDQMNAFVLAFNAQLK